jgi:putative PIN family toxin of toxin-antitoxin system
MRDRERVVIDTNALVSRLLVPRGTAGAAVRLALDSDRLLLSEAMLEELADVLARAKFDAYVTIGDRQQFIRLLARSAELVPIVRRVQACRDPKDDRVLEVAVNGVADLVLTGDRDLLSLHPFEGVAILAPADYLARRQGSAPG